METSRPIPLEVRVRMAHAAVQTLAEDAGADVLHVKGPASAPGLRGTQSPGTDVDILVRPAHVARLVAVLGRHGWHRETGFTSGSAFDHAANFFHESWGLLDVHRTYPGFDLDPAVAFDVLWGSRDGIDLAGISCPAPDRTSQSLMLLLHAARSPRGPRHPDVVVNWDEADAGHRAAVTGLAERLHARVGLAAAVGGLDAYASDPTSRLWRTFSEDGNRLESWRARLEAARGPGAKASVVVRSLGVNRYYLEQRLGRPATSADLAREFVGRLGRAAGEVRASARRRARRHRGEDRRE